MLYNSSVKKKKCKNSVGHPSSLAVSEKERKREREREREKEREKERKKERKEGRKEGRKKEGGKGGRREGRKEGRKEGTQQSARHIVTSVNCLLTLLKIKIKQIKYIPQSACF